MQNKDVICFHTFSCMSMTGVHHSAFSMRLNSMTQSQDEIKRPAAVTETFLFVAMC